MTWLERHTRWGQALLYLGILAAWEIFPRTGLVPRLFVPPLDEAIRTLITDRREYLGSLPTTFGEILAAYVVEVPDDLERWEGLNPGWVRVGEGVLLSRDYESRNEGHDEEQDESQALSHPTNSTKEVEWMGHPPLTQRSA